LRRCARLQHHRGKECRDQPSVPDQIASNAAASSGSSPHAATNELREHGVRNLLDAAVAAGAQRFVSESFFGVYGSGPYERPRTEDDPVGQERNGGIQAIIDAIASSEARSARPARSSASRASRCASAASTGRSRPTPR
jgi:nucleoside-diphosphate-sugar epimerase